MRKTLTALAMAATIAGATVANPPAASARDGRVAAGIIGGLALGAIIGSAFAAPYRYYGYYAYDPGYYGGPYAFYGGPYYYYGPYYAYTGPCYWMRERIWWRGRWVIRRVRVCY